MKRYKALTYLLIFSFAMLTAFSGCKPDEPIEEPPVDSDPMVIQKSPSTSYQLARVGETVNVEFEFHDNELLNNHWFTDKIISVSGVVVQSETEIPGSNTAVSTQTVNETLVYTVPNVPVYTTIEIRAYCKDNKGKQASRLFKINVIPDSSGGGSGFQLQEYNSTDTTMMDTLWTVASGDNYYYNIFDRVSGDQFEIAAPNRHLYGADPGGSPMQGIIESPYTNGADSVFAWTNVGAFNFDAATYDHMWQAYVTSNNYTSSAGPLVAGDVLIMKLLNTPHFAAIRIVKVVKINNGAGYFIFNYKYSY